MLCLLTSVNTLRPLVWVRWYFCIYRSLVWVLLLSVLMHTSMCCIRYCNMYNVSGTASTCRCIRLCDLCSQKCIRHEIVAFVMMFCPLTSVNTLRSLVWVRWYFRIYRPLVWVLSLCVSVRISTCCIRICSLSRMIYQALHLRVVASGTATCVHRSVSSMRLSLLLMIWCSRTSINTLWLLVCVRWYFVSTGH